MANGQNPWNRFWQGQDYQIGSDYTEAQQTAADTAYSNAAAALGSWSPDQSIVSGYQNYLNTINPGNLFARAGDPTQYQNFINTAMSDSGTAYRALAEQRSRDAADAAANKYNLGGAGGLFSGAAGQAIAEGAARPMTEAEVNLANLQAGMYQNLLAQNLASQQAELGTQAQGYGNLFSGQLSQDQQRLNNAIALANLFGQQAGSYDTAAMFGSGTGAMDFLNIIFGGMGAGADLYDRYADPKGTGGGDAPPTGAWLPDGGYSGTGFGGTQVNYTPATPSGGTGNLFGDLPDLSPLA